MLSSRESSQPRDRTWVSHIADGFFTVWATREALPCHTVWPKNRETIKNRDSFILRKKQLVTYKGTSIRLQADISAENLQARKKRHNIYNDDRKKATTKNTLPGKPIIQLWRRDKEFYRQAKAKRVQHL